MIEVSADTLAVRHGPVRWPGGRTLATTEVDQLFSPLFVEQQIEKHLRIVDRPVGGELPRS